MSNNRYQIVVTGELAEGAYLPDVKTRLAALFGTPVEKLDPLFSGRRLVIKKGLDEAAAGKYRAAVMAAGLLCSAEPMAVQPPANMTLAAPGAVLIDAPKVTAPQIDTTAFRIAPLGATMDESPRPVPPEIDTSALSAAPPGEDLIEPVPPEALEIDTSAFTMSPPGTQLVEPQPVTPPAFDLGNLDLAPVGSDMGEMGRPEGPPLPDIGHLKLDS